MRFHTLSLTILLLTPSVVLFAQAQRSGIVNGTVLNQDGRPVTAATVRCDPMDSRPSASDLRTVETDNEGRFVFDNLELRTFKLFAMKESEGFPNTAAAFYSNHVFPTVTLTGAAPVAEVMLRVGPPAAVVEGTVLDADSKSPVNAAILLRRASEPNNWISMSQPSDYRVLVPPGVDVLVEVLAPGYKTWYYGGAADVLKRPPIQLESLKKMRLDIELEPDERQHKP